MNNIKQTDAYPILDADTAGTGSRGSRLIRFIVITGVLVIGVGISGYFMSNRPRAFRRPPEAKSLLVDTMSVPVETHQIVVEAMGNVIAARSIDLAVRVSGEIQDISAEFIPGGYLYQGDPIVQVDSRDYRFTVRERESNLAKARSDFKVEMGQQEVSRREYEILGRNIDGADRELLLRQPQLAAIKAAVDAAEASLEQARLNLQRTTVKAPFNAVVKSRNVDLGSQVSAGMNLGSLIGTDEYWIQVSVPVSQLKWIDIPGPDRGEGSFVRVYNETAWGPDIWRKGKVIRQLSELEPKGLLAQLLIEVKDPLGQVTPTDYPLILGSYTRVDIEGKTVDNVMKIPENVLRERNTVWILTPENTLDVHPVDVVYQGCGSVLIQNGLPAESRVIISDISTPVNGMKLRVPGEKPAQEPGPDEGRRSDGNEERQS